MSTADRGNPIGTSAPWLRSRFRRYAFALITVVVATLLRAALGKLLGPSLPFIVFYPAIWLVAWMAGLGPASSPSFFPPCQPITCSSGRQLRHGGAFRRMRMG